ncbi:hypothetical protein EYC98_18575 [Halieaceae bacterium IMCC14734]|uniref:DUF805 domain-containing protein n=1 Tax=Candidatus Litorirhabdus singularis TaxID=2518993 RepID=A0ABT3TKN9_9GAMM|nr:hypothetical protein [Candidatus Litorirhabdus singularis]MCX2982873.1 hypothetical protein [Candidatus Litorirhabdus singularis]
MEYKLSDFFREIWRKLKCVKENHLFLCFFFVFIVFLGTCGLWIEPLLGEYPPNWDRFTGGLNTTGLLSISAPLVAVTIFDSVLRLVTKYRIDPESIDADLLVWLTLFTIILIVVLAVLFALGGNTTNGYSLCAISAWVLVIFYWAIANIDNPSYQIPGDPGNANGTDSYDDLMTGGS